MLTYGITKWDGRLITLKEQVLDLLFLFYNIEKYWRKSMARQKKKQEQQTVKAKNFQYVGLLEDHVNVYASVVFEGHTYLTMCEDDIMFNLEHYGKQDSELIKAVMAVQERLDERCNNRVQ